MRISMCTVIHSALMQCTSTCCVETGEAGGRPVGWRTYLGTEGVECGELDGDVGACRQSAESGQIFLVHGSGHADSAEMVDHNLQTGRTEAS